MMRTARHHAKQSPQAVPQSGAPAAGGRVAGYGPKGAPVPRQCPPSSAGQVPQGVWRGQQVQAAPPGWAVPGQQPPRMQQGHQQVQMPAAYVRPVTSMPPQAQPRKKRRIVLWVAIAVVLICLIAAGFVVFGMLNGGGSRSGLPGQLEGKTDAEIQAELDRIVEEGMFNVSIASVVQMPSGTSPAELRIENVPGNRYLMKVVLTLDDTGQQVYETDAIEPNFHIQQDTLDVELPAGVYDATATFTALDPETEEEVGTAAAKVLIQVQS